MNSYFQEFVSLLLYPPGNLVYHLVLAFSIAAALATALSFWQSTAASEGKRMVIGLSLLLFLRLVLFVAAGLSWQGMINGSILLPPLDRFISLMGTILIAWMWVFPKPSRMGDVATVLLSLIGVTVSVMSLVWWSNQVTLSDYNGSWADTASVMLCLGITTASGLLLAMRRPAGWGNGLGMLAILLIGDVAYLTYPYPEGDYSGAVRLAQMIAYPMLLLLPQRFRENAGEARQEPSPASNEQAANSSSTPSGNFYLSLVKLAVDTPPLEVHQAVVRMIAQEWLADVCLLLSAPGPHGKMEILSGFDLIREQTLGKSIVNSQSIPVIASALRRGRALRLPASSTSPDLAGLGKVLDVKMVGHILAAPVCDPKGELIAGLVLLTPYSRRSWSPEDQLRLTDFVLPLAQVLQHSDYSARLLQDLEQSQAALKTAQLETEKTRKENEQLLTRFGIASESDGNSRLHAASLAALIVAHEEAQDTISRLQAEIHLLQQGDIELAQATNENIREQSLQDEAQKGSDQQAEAELRLALEEVAYLKSLIYEADKRLLVLRNEQPITSSADEHLKEISTVAQELRQPLSSIIGYTDFLLGESIGILGMLQHRFLERIRASSDRMAKLVEHLINLSGADEILLPNEVETVQLSSLIDEAISKTSHAMQEKKIALRMDFPHKLPELRNNRGALEQVLVTLLNNASNLSPADGEIAFRVRLKGEEDAKDYVLIQVAHQSSDISFDQLLKSQAGSPVSGSQNILSLNQEQFSIPLLKTLAESLGGRIWVDSETGSSLTYSLLFPITISQFSGSNGSGGLV